MSVVPKNSGSEARNLAPVLADSLAEGRRRVIQLLKDLGHEKRTKPFRLSSGELSQDYVDGKRAIANGRDLQLVAQVILQLVTSRVGEFDAVGGLTMGADPLAHGVSMLSGKDWFSVRKEPKQHGSQRLIEGVRLASGMRVLLLDDVVTTGKSILQAVNAIEEMGVTVVLAISLLDRGNTAKQRLEQKGIPYEPLTTYSDLEIAPIGD